MAGTLGRRFVGVGLLSTSDVNPQQIAEDHVAVREAKTFVSKYPGKLGASAIDRSSCAGFEFEHSGIGCWSIREGPSDAQSQSRSR
jgi:hypothetical protein